jgi:hypothetical protein
MGIGRTGGRDLVVALRAGTATKTELRAELGDAVTVLQKKLTALDIQLAEAALAFADSRPAQFRDFVAALPSVGDDV